MVDLYPTLHRHWNTHNSSYIRGHTVGSNMLTETTTDTNPMRMQDTDGVSLAQLRVAGLQRKKGRHWTSMTPDFPTNATQFAFIIAACWIFPRAPTRSNVYDDLAQTTTVVVWRVPVRIMTTTLSIPTRICSTAVTPRWIPWHRTRQRQQQHEHEQYWSQYDE